MHQHETRLILGVNGPECLQVGTPMLCTFSFTRPDGKTACFGQKLMMSNHVCVSSLIAVDYHVKLPTSMPCLARLIARKRQRVFVYAHVSTYRVCQKTVLFRAVAEKTRCLLMRTLGPRR